MSEIVPAVPDVVGNTNTTSKVNKPQDNPCKRYCFTLNNYSVKELHEIISFLKENSAKNKYLIGKEEGEMGTPHLQGYIELHKKVRMSSLFKINERIHWEKCKGSRDDNIKYCTKDNDYISEGFNIERPVEILNENQLYDWQKFIVEIIKQKPDNRRVYWLWENKGGRGKTTFSKYLSIRHNAIPLEGRKNDILYCAAMFPSDIYIYDLERTMENCVSYGAIEKIKNGYFMCSKYESKPVIRNSPHVIIFANFEPDYEKLSKDRWHVTNLDEIPEEPLDQPLDNWVDIIDKEEEELTLDF